MDAGNLQVPFNDNSKDTQAKLANGSVSIISSYSGITGYSSKSPSGQLHFSHAVPMDYQVQFYSIDSSEFAENRYIFTKERDCIGEGTYGAVYIGVDSHTGAKVALKRIKMLSSMDGVPITTIREIMILKHLSKFKDTRDRCVTLETVCQSHNLVDIYLIFPYVEHSLLSINFTISKQLQFKLKQYNYSLTQSQYLKYQLTDLEIALLFKNLLEALIALSRAQIIHRDIKPDNLLVSVDGYLKLCDFGLAVGLNSGRAQLTRGVPVVHYRSPELLLGSTTYGHSVDVWSAGCCLLQQYLHRPPFIPHLRPNTELEQPGIELGKPGTTTELEQLLRISQIFGSQGSKPSEFLKNYTALINSEYPGNDTSEISNDSTNFRQWFIKEWQYTQRKYKCSDCSKPGLSNHRAQHANSPSEELLSVLECMLKLNPHKRSTPEQLLSMPFFAVLNRPVYSLDKPLYNQMALCYPNLPHSSDSLESIVRQGLVNKLNLFKHSQEGLYRAKVNRANKA